jgi:hypothetical protein
MTDKTTADLRQQRSASKSDYLSGINYADLYLIEMSGIHLWIYRLLVYLGYTIFILLMPVFRFGKYLEQSFQQFSVPRPIMIPLLSQKVFFYALRAFVNK